MAKSTYLIKVQCWTSQEQAHVSVDSWEAPEHRPMASSGECAVEDALRAVGEIQQLIRPFGTEPRA